jgi:hypothetical protein
MACAEEGPAKIAHLVACVYAVTWFTAVIYSQL